MCTKIWIALLFDFQYQIWFVLLYNKNRILNQMKLHYFIDLFTYFWTTVFHHYIKGMNTNIIESAPYDREVHQLVDFTL